MIKVKENFLDKKDFTQIQERLFGERFYWSLANDVVSKRPEWGATCEEIYNS